MQTQLYICFSMLFYQFVVFTKQWPRFNAKLRIDILLNLWILFISRYHCSIYKSSEPHDHLVWDT